MKSATATFEAFQLVRADMNSVLLERARAVDNSLLALLTRQHYLQYGSPGTAKSHLVRALLHRITGNMRLFRKGLNPSTTPDDLLGPHDSLARVREGRHVRVHTRSIVEAHIAFLDEIGRANKMCLDLFLQIFNEREVDEVGMDEILHLPLMSIFATTNTVLTHDDDLRAINDRFLLREEIVRVTDPVNRGILLRGAPNAFDPGVPTMSFAQIEEAQRLVPTVKVAPEIDEATLALEQDLSLQRITISDRMLGWSHKLIKAHAWLNGRDQAVLGDLMVLAHSWWTDPKQRKEVQKTVYKMACPSLVNALDTQDSAEAELAALPPVTDSAYQNAAGVVHRSFTHMIQKLEIDKLKASPGEELATIEAVHARITQMDRDLRRQLLTMMNMPDLVQALR